MALRLLKCAADSSDISSANNYKQNLLHILAAKSKPGTQKDLQLQVCAEAYVGSSLLLYNCLRLMLVYYYAHAANSSCFGLFVGLLEDVYWLAVTVALGVICCCHFV